MFKLIWIWVLKLRYFAFSRTPKRQPFIFSSDIGFLRRKQNFNITLNIKPCIRYIRFLSSVEQCYMDVALTNLMTEMTSMNLINLLHHKMKRLITANMPNICLIPATEKIGNII